MPTSKRNNPINVPSLLLTDEENSHLFRIVGKRCSTQATAVVQVFLAEPPNYDQWAKKCCGVACFIKDNSRRSYFIRVFDLKHECAIWEQELYLQFKYYTPLPFFHTFDSEFCPAALNFADQREAEKFQSAVETKLRQRLAKQNASVSQIERSASLNSPPHQKSHVITPNHIVPGPIITRNDLINQNNNIVPISSASINRSISNATLKKRGEKAAKNGPNSAGFANAIRIRKKDGKKSLRIKKADIGQPTNFQHINHVGWDPNKGYQGDSMNPLLRDLFHKAGVTEKHLRDKETSEFIYDFIGRQGLLSQSSTQQNNFGLAGPISQQHQQQHMVSPIHVAGNMSTASNIASSTRTDGTWQNQSQPIKQYGNKPPYPSEPPKLASNNATTAYPLSPSSRPQRISFESQLASETNYLPPMPSGDLDMYNANYSTNNNIYNMRQINNNISQSSNRLLSSQQPKTTPLPPPPVPQRNQSTTLQGAKPLPPAPPPLPPPNPSGNHVITSPLLSNGNRNPLSKKPANASTAKLVNTTNTNSTFSKHSQAHTVPPPPPPPLPTLAAALPRQPTINNDEISKIVPSSAKQSIVSATKAPDSRTQLMSQIRQGINLKSVNPSTSKASLNRKGSRPGCNNNATPGIGAGIPFSPSMLKNAAINLKKAGGDNHINNNNGGNTNNIGGFNKSSNNNDSNNNLSNANDPELDGVAGALARALQERAKVIQSTSDSSENDDFEDDWEED